MGVLQLAEWLCHKVKRPKEFFWDKGVGEWRLFTTRMTDLCNYCKRAWKGQQPPAGHGECRDLLMAVATGKRFDVRAAIDRGD